MIKTSLIFANRKQLREAASGSNYGSHTREVLVEQNWIYETTASPLFTIGFTLKYYGLAKTFEEQQALSRKYRCYRVTRET